MRIPLLLAASAVALMLAGGASAQQTEAQARARAATQALNGGPATSTLQRQVTPEGEILSWPDRPFRSRPATPAPAADPDRTLEALLGSIEYDAGTNDTPAVVLAEGETAPAPIPVALGYYVRGEMDCDQVWPGEGNLAFLTPTAFTIDFGGCTPGQFLQTGPNSWRERQQCQTELGGDAGAYVVDYEMVETGVLQRTARLQIDNSVEQDRWRFCETEDVPENARFASDSL
ncbi:hypothetical protein [Brevundimonas bacteroides]|uniref:hypothetical protein n=1 Tax=Brevundimonas bacteroides TaxID=74311 RepID=UPI0012ED7BB4|nr:hypothetical protein [Brevundimonas bacteroides]